MTTLIVGLVALLGVHSVRIFADDWRSRRIAQIGLGPWKLTYTAASLVGLALIIWGYGMARANPVVVWQPPVFARHVTMLFTIVGFILVAAAYVPGTRTKAALGHPMTAGVALWAFGHLLGNGRLAGVVLFGAFLAWAIILFVVRRRRDRESGTRYPAGNLTRDATAAAIGLIAAIVFALFLHAPLIGVRPFA